MMTDSKKLTLAQHITEKLEYLDGLIYHHQCNIPEPDVQQEREYHQAWGERQALQKVKDLIGETNDIEEEEGVTFEVSSGFGHNTEAPYVQVLIPKADWMTQMPPATARELALNLLTCAEAAESDGFLVGFLQKTIGVENMRTIVSVLFDFREHREKQRGGSE